MANPGDVGHGRDEADGETVSPSRRRFLSRGTALVGGAMAGGLAAETALAEDPNGPPNVPEWMKAPGADTGAQPYGAPSPFEKHVVKNIPKSLKQYTSASVRTPLQDLDGIITPNGLFYERHHGGVPAIDPAQHRLMIHGLVERPLILTMEDIRRFPSESHVYFLECSGNPDFKAIQAGKTASDLVGLVSCAEWTGVRLKTVLEEAGLKPGAKWVVAEGADSAGLTRSIPIEKCLDDALLVYSQNGERLRPQQGYPLRVLLPGFEGNMSVKWLRRLNVTDEPAYSREETAKYTDLMPDGTARQFTFMMEAKSIITRPSGTQRIARGFNEITGIAWSGRGKITRVEISVDDGRTWQDAGLQAPVLNKALTRFRLPWSWNGEPAIIHSRATDETGYVQPSFDALTKARGMNSFYHDNAVIPWRIAASGEVSNGYPKA
ncbi:sulfite dehydrogenase [Methylobacterium brachythecii]|uniref:Sulfane dehydrogenase subunit SoxC n=1 Tax=Methylobacterium brachythecii TaxID=1176177 RepID=A0A7W6F572_9HYPH|nr:sulfite dehydrogenase [Methylobacterium brachythecii]MBB3901100.1 sulfane dehydrogenase subunit SoxC [Methylobacterium brachythecii]GLS45214.1 sulfite dehydrogenase [Methylobacterium brachythecii]